MSHNYDALHYAFPLPPGSKQVIIKRPGMIRIVNSLLRAPSGMLTAAVIRTETELPAQRISGYLRTLKQYGLISCTYARNGDVSWWVVPAIRSSLAIFANSPGVME